MIFGTMRTEDIVFISYAARLLSEKALAKYSFPQTLMSATGIDSKSRLDK